MNVIASRKNQTPDHPVEILNHLQRQRAGRADIRRRSRSSTRYSDNRSNGATALCPELTWPGSDDDLAISHEAVCQRSPNYSCLYYRGGRKYNFDYDAKERKRKCRYSNDVSEESDITPKATNVLWRALRWAIAISLAVYISTVVLSDDGPQIDTLICGPNIFTTSLQSLGYCLPQPSHEKGAHVTQPQSNDSRHPVTESTSDITVSSGAPSPKTPERPPPSTALASTPLGQFHDILADLHKQVVYAKGRRHFVFDSDLDIVEVSTSVIRSNLTGKEDIHMALKKIMYFDYSIRDLSSRSFIKVQSMVDTVDESNKPALEKLASIRQKATERGLPPHKYLSYSERRAAGRAVLSGAEKVWPDMIDLIPLLERIQEDLERLSKQWAIITMLAMKEDQHNWRGAMVYSYVPQLNFYPLSLLPALRNKVLQVVERYLPPPLLRMQIDQLLDEIHSFEFMARFITTHLLKTTRYLQWAIKQAEKQYGGSSLKNISALDEAVGVLNAGISTFTGRIRT